MTHPTEPPMIEVNGFAFRVIRKLSGLDAGPCADLVGVDRSYLNRLENGTRRRVSPEVFAGMLRALSLTDRRAILANPHGLPVVLDTTPTEQVGA
jgi:transcriptional regulator with XRE-family HTH domain